MNVQARKRVANATVRTYKGEGCGIFVGHGLILTAGHCTDFTAEGNLVLGSHHFEVIQTISGKLIHAGIWAVEPVADIAALGSLDNQTFTQEADEFEQFCEATDPVPISSGETPWGQPCTVHIFTHTGDWLKGMATVWGEGSTASLALETESPIMGGKSGSGVFNDAGELVGIVSWSTEGETTGGTARPLMALPTWLCRRLLEGEKLRSITP